MTDTLNLNFLGPPGPAGINGTNGTNGSNGLLTAASAGQLDAGTDNTVTVTPAGLAHLGLDGTIGPKAVALDASYPSSSAFPLSRVGVFGGMQRIYQALVRGGADTVMRLPGIMKRRGNYIDWSKPGLFGPWLYAIASRPGLSGLERRYFAIHGKTGEAHFRLPKRLTHGRNTIDMSFDGKRGAHSFAFVQRVRSAGGDIERVAFSIGRDNSLKYRADTSLQDDHPTGAWRAWASKVAGVYQVFAQDTATAAITQLTFAGNNDAPRFSHDGSRIHYRTDRALIYQRVSQPLSAAAARVTIVGKVMTVVTALRNSFVVGQKLTGIGIAAGTLITGANIDGTFNLSAAATVTNGLVYAAGGIELPVSASRVIVGMGDSMTENSATGYGPIFAPLLPPNVIFLNQGIGGQRIQQIAARYGALPVTCTVTGGVIPTSGSVAITNLNINLLGAGYNVTIRAIIAGVLGYLTYTSSTLSYSFTPLNYPTSAIAASGTQSITVKSAFVVGTSAAAAMSIEDMWAAELICRGVRNDIGKTSSNPNGGAYSQATALAAMIAMYSANTATIKKVTFSTVTISQTDLPTSYTTAPFTLGGNVDPSTPDLQLVQITQLNAAMFAHPVLGPVTVDIMAAHKTAGETAQATVNSFTYDVLTATLDTPANNGTHETDAAKLTTSNLYLANRAAKGF